MTKEEEKYTTLDTDQCKWWVNTLFNMAKEKACNSHNFDDGEEIQAAQDKIIKSLEQQPSDDCVSLAGVYEIMGDLISIPCNLDRRITEQDVSESIDRIRELPIVQPKTDVLDKIRAEIRDGLYGLEEMNETDPERAEAFNNGLNYCTDIIDKYRESEGE